MRARGARPPAGKEVCENRALHFFAIAKSAQNFSNYATLPSFFREILRHHTRQIWSASIRIGSYPRPDLFAWNMPHRTRISSAETHIPAEPASDYKTADIHWQLYIFGDHAPGIDRVFSYQFVQISIALRP